MAIAGFAFAKNIFQKALSPMPAMLNHVQLELLQVSQRFWLNGIHQKKPTPIPIPTPRPWKIERVIVIATEKLRNPVQLFHTAPFTQYRVVSAECR
jgi:hypothetical protein